MEQSIIQNTAEIGFEQQIWTAADKLRGNIDASEYKNVVLGLIFLKYISDKFASRYQELIDEGEGFEEDRDEYTYKNIFWVPKKARWDEIAGAAHTPEIGKVIDNAMRLIETENDKLKGILPKNFARQELDKRRLGEVVDLFTNIKMAEAGDTRDILGRTYEYCLAKFAEAEGRNAGEFYTPACVVRTLVEIIQPFHGRVYDPCCGSGGMFVQSADFVRRHQGNINDLSIYGQESNPTTWKMAVMNLAIRGIDANLGDFSADTFFADVHKNERFDFVLANPPFNDSEWGGDQLIDDVRWKYGTPPTGNANFAWVQHMIYHLNQSGRMGLVLANGALSASANNEGNIRRAIIEDDIVEGIVVLPAKLFYSTQIPVSLWIIDKHKKQPGKMLFINAEKLGVLVTRNHRELIPETDIKKIADAFDAFRNGSLVEQPGFSAIATLENIKSHDYKLTPGYYVSLESTDGDDEPYHETLSVLAREIFELVDTLGEQHALLEQRLKVLGFER